MWYSIVFPQFSSGMSLLPVSDMISLLSSKPRPLCITSISPELPIQAMHAPKKIEEE